MTENTAPARCTDEEWKLARDSGLPIFTTADEVAIHKFADSIRTVTLSAIDAKDAEIARLRELLTLMVRTHDEPAETQLQEMKEQQWLAQARAALNAKETP